MNYAKNSVFGMGTVVLDHVCQLGKYPEPDTKQMVQTHFQQIGGPVPIALSVAAFYGTSASFFSRWGHDTAGSSISQGLRQREIDISTAQTNAEWNTGFAHVWTESTHGTRTIACMRGDFPAPTEADFDKAWPRFSNARILHLDGWGGRCIVAAARAMRRQNGCVVLDAGSVKPHLDELLPHVDVLIASALFRRSYFGTENVSDTELLNLGPAQILLTDGSEGARLVSRKHSLHQPAFPVHAVDTNGAGDIFSGAIVHCLSRGIAIPNALPFACGVAAWACKFPGNSTWPTRQQLLEEFGIKSPTD